MAALELGSSSPRILFDVRTHELSQYLSSRLFRGAACFKKGRPELTLYPDSEANIFHVLQCIQWTQK